MVLRPVNPTWMPCKISPRPLKKERVLPKDRRYCSIHHWIRSMWRTSAMDRKPTNRQPKSSNKIKPKAIKRIILIWTLSSKRRKRTSNMVNSKRFRGKKTRQVQSSRPAIRTRVPSSKTSYQWIMIRWRGLFRDWFQGFLNLLLFRTSV
jgi:hypothetical protein